MLLFSFSCACSAAFTGNCCSTIAPPSLPLCLSVSSRRRGVSQVAYWKVKPRCAHSLRCVKCLSLYPSLPSAFLQPCWSSERSGTHAHAADGERKKERRKDDRKWERESVVWRRPTPLPPTHAPEQPPHSGHPSGTDSLFPFLPHLLLLLLLLHVGCSPSLGCWRTMYLLAGLLYHSEQFDLHFHSLK